MFNIFSLFNKAHTIESCIAFIVSWVQKIEKSDIPKEAEEIISDLEKIVAQLKALKEQSKTPQ